jgi:hypothetical protein
VPSSCAHTIAADSCSCIIVGSAVYVATACALHRASTPYLEYLVISEAIENGDFSSLFKLNGNGRPSNQRYLCATYKTFKLSHHRNGRYAPGSLLVEARKMIRISRPCVTIQIDLDAESEDDTRLSHSQNHNWKSSSQSTSQNHNWKSSSQSTGQPPPLRAAVQSIGHVVTVGGECKSTSYSL